MQKLNYYPHFQSAFQKLSEIEGLLKSSVLPHGLIHLVKIRASQINGCAFCVDMHVKEATIDDVRPLKLHHIAVWRESNLFSEAERVALEWTEAVTKLSQDHVADELVTKVKATFPDKELTELTMAIGMINLWNRFAAPFSATPGGLDKMYGLDRAKL